MNSTGQRFCPLCDRAFVESEAVLACGGCGVLHHPACWVKNGGCSTERDHLSNPSAIPYTSGPAVTGPGLRPGEGIRQFRPQREPEAPLAPASEEPLVHTGPALAAVPPLATGEDEPATAEPDLPFAPPPRTQPVRRPPETPRQGPGAPIGGRSDLKPLPRIYGRQGMMKVIYGLAAVFVLLFIFAIIRITDAIFVSNDGPPAAPTSAPTTLVATSTPDPAASPSPPLTSGRFAVGDTLAVAGAGDCLNVRVQAGIANDAVICLNDGERVTVVGGPRQADGRTWWNVRTRVGDGWAVEEFLTRTP